MGVSFWSDEVSKKIEATNRDASTLWKISNLLCKISIFSVIFGFLLLIFAATAVFFFDKSDTTDTTETIVNVIPINAFLLFILGGFAFAFYTLVVAIIAFYLKNYGWATVTLFIGITAPYYKYLKGKEIRGERKGLVIAKWSLSSRWDGS